MPLQYLLLYSFGFEEFEVTFIIVARYYYLIYCSVYEYRYDIVVGEGAIDGQTVFVGLMRIHYSNIGDGRNTKYVK